MRQSQSVKERGGRRRSPEILSNDAVYASPSRCLTASKISRFPSEIFGEHRARGVAPGSRKRRRRGMRRTPPPALCRARTTSPPVLSGRGMRKSAPRAARRAFWRTRRGSKPGPRAGRNPPRLRARTSPLKKFSPKFFRRGAKTPLQARQPPRRDGRRADACRRTRGAGLWRRRSAGRRDRRARRILRRGARPQRFPCGS